MIVKGQKVNDRYQIIKTIGEGGMANVYLAYDTILDRNVAVKVLRGDLATDEKFVRRFQREALSASSLSHPNIVEVYDVGEDNGSYYIVMEYIEGKQLKQLLKKRGKLTLTEVVDIMLQVTDGMSAAHDSYIIHRDIKPQNIMILENGLIKITDFGIAMALNSTQLTQTNSVMGSVHYLPPEQASGKGATIQSDIYSMGILMYELLTGELPFRGDNAVEIALKQIKEPLPDITTKLPNIPQSIANIIMKATAKNPKNRYADAREMNDDLKTALSSERENEAKYVLKYPESENENIKKNEVRVTPIPTEQENPDKPAKSPKAPKTKKEEPKKEENEDVEVKAKKIDEKTEIKKENKLLVILAIIFTSLVVIVTTMVFLLPEITKVKNVTVPDVSNMSVVDAENKLESLGLVVNEDEKEVSSSEVEAGKVVKTSPQAKRTVKKGASITLYVSSGENGYTVEDLTGKNYLEVKGALESTYNLYVIVSKMETDQTVDADVILKTDPAVGTVLKPGDTITLYIPLMNTSYPDFTKNYTLSQIQAWCEKYGVTYAEVYDQTSLYEAGTIYAQSIASGTTVQAGQTLTIHIAEAVDDSDNTGTDMGE
ncbi:MAG TPA: Stk1 family PASTA domain-containing Ser/Thr kinase [Bacilli bacterium]|nr:Stk1 family PASTA domain-containing Ser/Thr kinase [Bacilli bacterium]HPZ23242.1 Stk1 family PASTA domain-containing Ser/Thr kinase [Bacilli bacterium]